MAGTIDNDHDALHDEAIAHILKRIVKANSSAATRDLAEAYAWLTSPAQSHGGSTRVTSN